MFVDTHAHLFWDSYTTDLDEILQRDRAAGIEKVVVPGINTATSRKAVELAKQYPGILYAAVGVHPEEAEEIKDLGSWVEELEKLIIENKGQVVGIGETGIDLYTPEMQKVLPQQKQVFTEMGKLALSHGLPMLIHTRQSLAETIEVLDSLPAMPRGVFHCFSHDEVGLKEVLQRGFYVSFCGNITWSKRVRRLVKSTPPKRLLFETDSPFMAPRDNRNEPLEKGLRNTPRSVTILAPLQAEELNIPLALLADQVRHNTKELLGI